MNKPTLRYTAWLGDIPVEGECTSCPNEGKFHVAGGRPSREENEKALQKAFDLHFKSVHMREDASQAAVRIVREATKD